jgi:hypothetical protein
LPRHPVRTPPLGGSHQPLAASAKGTDSDSHRVHSTPGTVQGTPDVSLLVVTPRAIDNPPRPVSWTAPPAIRCERGDDEGHDDSEIGLDDHSALLPRDSARIIDSSPSPTAERRTDNSPCGSDDGSRSPAPSRREAMAAAWLREIDSLAMSCRSDQSDSLPQRPQRRAVSRPSSVPPLDLTGLVGSCPEDSDGEVIGVDDNSYEENGFVMRQAPEAPSPSEKVIRDVSTEVPGPLTDNCSGSGNGGSSTASTRAASTPSAHAHGGPPSPCPQVLIAPQTLVARSGMTA